MNTPINPSNRNIVPYTAGDEILQVIQENDDVWLTQRQIAALFDLTVQAISQAVQAYRQDGGDKSTIKLNLIVAEDGKQREVEHYNLDVITFIGFRARSNQRTIDFRKWAVGIIRRFIIGDLRSSEKQRFDELKGLLALASDYDKDSALAQSYFATVQNKLLYAITEHTAADLIGTRANHEVDNMGLTHWKGNNITLADATVGKNYLTRQELQRLEALVNYIYLGAPNYERDRATMKEWIEFIDTSIINIRMALLTKYKGYDKEEAKEIARREYELYKQQLKLGNGQD